LTKTGLVSKQSYREKALRLDRQADDFEDLARARAHGALLKLYRSPSGPSWCASLSTCIPAPERSGQVASGRLHDVTTIETRFG